MHKESTYSREMFAITESIGKWRQYLLGRRFFVEIEHQSLRPLHHQTIQASEQQKWLTQLLGFDFDICYRPGRENQPADVVSRMVDHTFIALQISSKLIIDMWDALKEFYQKHPASAQLMKPIQETPTDFPYYLVQQGLIWFKGKVFIPSDSTLQRLILTELHNMTELHNG